MSDCACHIRFLIDEARSLYERLRSVRPFVLQMPTVPAAAVSAVAMHRIEEHLQKSRCRLRGMIIDYLDWLESGPGRRESPAKAHRRYSSLRLRFNAALAQVDIFSDVLTQRAEHETGVWLAGLDELATDGLRLRGKFFESPCLLTYLDRGLGAAIRRVRTRLPGGDPSPVSIIRVPRERMIGSAVGSSLIHEVGHQGAALLDLVPSLQASIRSRRFPLSSERLAWKLLDRWISEIVADLWSVAFLGVASTAGLMGVVSLPRAFVFRVAMDDPHPFPWIRVKISAAVGQALYPDAQWDKLSRLWEEFYPTRGLDAQTLNIVRSIEGVLDEFAHHMVGHRPASLHGRSLHSVLPTGDRSPDQLRRISIVGSSSKGSSATRIVAALGQARFEGRISPQQESQILERHLVDWASQRFRTLDSPRIGRNSGRLTAVAPGFAASAQTCRR